MMKRETGNADVIAKHVNILSYPLASNRLELKTVIWEEVSWYYQKIQVPT